jgi:hypothetical protein
MVKQQVRVFLIIEGLVASNLACFPLAYVLGTMISGWDPPPWYIEQGADVDAIDAALPQMVVTLVLLLLVVNAFWVSVINKTVVYRRRQ